MINQRLTKAQQEAIVSEHCKKWSDRQPSEADMEIILELRNNGAICEDTFLWLMGEDPFLEEVAFEFKQMTDKERRRYWAIRAKTGGMPKRATTRRKKPKKDEA